MNRLGLCFALVSFIGGIAGVLLVYAIGPTPNLPIVVFMVAFGAVIGIVYYIVLSTQAMPLPQTSRHVDV